MLLEPPGPHLPAGPRLTISLTSALRLAAAAAALVLAVSSRGDAVVLGLLLLGATARPTVALALATALTASSVRFGASSLEALSGAQAVLGPAGWVGPTSSAVGSWLAALALLLAGARRVGPLVPSPPPARVPGERLAAPRAPRRPGPADLVLAAAAGATTALVVAGPAPGGAIWARVAVGLAATVLALLLGEARRRHRDLDLGLDAAATLAGVAALIAVRAEGGAWAGLVERDVVVEGLAVAGVVTVVVAAVLAAVALLRGARWSVATDAA